MSVRRLNFTDRKRVARHDVSIALDRASTPPAFDVLLDLSDYAFPSDAEVVVEAAADWTVMRFQFGTIGEPPEAMHGALS